DLLGGPFMLQLLGHQFAQRLVALQQTGLGPLGARPGCLLGRLCPIPVIATIALDFPRDGRGRTVQPCSDLPHGAPGGQAAGNLLALCQRQLPFCTYARRRLNAAVVPDVPRNSAAVAPHRSADLTSAFPALPPPPQFTTFELGSVTPRSDPSHSSLHNGSLLLH